MEIRLCQDEDWPALWPVLQATFAAAGIQAPALGLAHSVSTRILCAASLSGSCAGEG